MNALGTNATDIPEPPPEHEPAAAAPAEDPRGWCREFEGQD